MTCEEFRKTAANVHPNDATLAPVAAVFKHAKSCPACMAMVENAPDDDSDPVDFERIMRVYDDPEALEVLRGK